METAHKTAGSGGNSFRSAWSKRASWAIATENAGRMRFPEPGGRAGARFCCIGVRGAPGVHVKSGPCRQRVRRPSVALAAAHSQHRRCERAFVLARRFRCHRAGALEPSHLVDAHWRSKMARRPDSMWCLGLVFRARVRRRGVAGLFCCTLESVRTC